MATTTHRVRHETKAAPERNAALEPKQARRRLAPEDRRRELLEVGLRMFGERPYEDVATEDVAAAAGISKALMFHYFPRKLDFYRASLEIASQRLLDATEPVPSLPKPLQLYASLDAYLGFVERYSTSYTMLMRIGVSAPEAAEIVQATRDVFVGRFGAALGVSTPPPAFTLVLYGWLAFVERTSVDWLTSRGIAREALLQIWVQQLTSALTAAQAADPSIVLDLSD